MVYPLKMVIYHLVMPNIAIEAMAIEIDGLPGYDIQKASEHGPVEIDSVYPAK